MSVTALDSLSVEELIARELEAVDARIEHAQQSSAASRSSTASAARARNSVLAFYCAASFLCAGAWNTLAPLAAVAESRFGVGQAGVTAVSLAGFATYPPGSLLALYCMARHGLRTTLGVGCATQAACCLLKWAGVSLCTSREAAYALLLLGQVVGGLGQPCVLNVVTRLTMDWFPPERRDAATLLGYQASNAGAVVFNAVPAWLVHRGDDLAALFAAQALPWLALCALLPRAVPADAPLLPPSAAAAQQWAARRTAAAQRPPGMGPGGAAVRSLGRDLVALARHRNFRLLALTFSCTAGLGWALPTVEGIMLQPCGYGPRVAGGAGAALLAAGVAASLLYGGRTAGGVDGYCAAQRQLSAISAAAAAVLMGTMLPGRPAAVLAAWAAFGASQGPLGPVTLEHAAEATYPINADSSSAALFIISNGASFAQATLLQHLLRRPASAACASPATPAAAFVATSMLAGMAAAWRLKDEGRRAAAERGSEPETKAPGPVTPSDEVPLTGP